MAYAGNEIDILNTRVRGLETEIKKHEKLLLAALELCAAIGTDAVLRPGVPAAERERIRNDAANIGLLIDQCLKGDET